MWLERNPHTFCYCGNSFTTTHTKLWCSQWYSSTILHDHTRQLLHACHHGQFKHRIMRSLFCLKRGCTHNSSSSSSSCPSCPVLLPSFRFFANALIHMLCFQHVTYLSAHLFAATSIHPIRHCPCVLRLHSCQPFHFHFHFHFHFFHFHTQLFQCAQKNVPRLSTDNNITLARHYHKNNPNVLPCLHKN